MTATTTELAAPVLERRSMSGEVLGSVQLDPTIFGVAVNVPLLHQVITAQLANRRSGTQSTKTRAEVAGGSSKPFRQKGTGNARQGSIRAPHYSGGGVAHGPKPRSYAQRTPKKMVQAALRCALSDRARAGELRLVDALTFESPKTKDAIATLAALECEGRVLVVLAKGEDSALRSFRNLSYVVTLPTDQLTAYDVLGADVVVFTDDTIPGENTPLETKPARARRTPAPKADAAEPETAADVEAGEVEAAGEVETETPVKAAAPAKAPKASATPAPGAEAPAAEVAEAGMNEEDAK
ncbi:MAG TPA: 50S ribosomal protein L4 [Acidimicrobiales bacterium]|nr:50S ribosomal protein L4 [Acidimicrobiales bacterium]